MQQNAAVSYSYSPYGAVAITRGGVAQSTDPLGQHWSYTGRFFDEETGLYYYRARYYNPATGRFFQRDPLGYAAGPSLYEYAHSSPTVFCDPLGLDPPKLNAKDNQINKNAVANAKAVASNPELAKGFSHGSWAYYESWGFKGQGRWKDEPYYIEPYMCLVFYVEGNGSPKCNLFVCQVLKASGFTGETLRPWRFGMRKYPWTANDWFNGRVKSFNEVPADQVAPGDVVA